MSAESGKALIFKRHGRLFAIPVGSVREILQSHKIVPLPMKDERVRGLVNTGSGIIPVLKVDDDQDTPMILIVMSLDSVMAAIPADDVITVEEFQEQKIPEFPITLAGSISSRWPNLIRGLGNIRGSTVISLDPEAIRHGAA